MLVVLTLTLFPFPTHAQDQPSFSNLTTVDPLEGKTMPPVDEMARKYYDRCMDKPDVLLSYDDQNDFCVCTTVKMLESFKPEQMVGMADGKTASDLEPSDLSIKIYGPCLYITAPSIVNQECRGDRQINSVTRNTFALDSTCNCIAAGTKLYFKKYAAIQLAALEKMGFSVLDPLDAIRRSPDYIRDHQDTKKACAAKYRKVKQ